MLISVESSTLDKLMEKIDVLASEVRKKNEYIFPEVMVTEEAAKYLRVTERHLLVMKRKKQVVYSQCGKVIRFRKSDLDDYLNKYRVQRA